MNNTINTIRLNKFLQILFRNHFALVKWVIIDFERSSIEKKSVTIKGNEVDGRLATNEIQFEISALWINPATVGPDEISGIFHV